MVEKCHKRIFIQQKKVKQSMRFLEDRDRRENIYKTTNIQKVQTEHELGGNSESSATPSFEC